MSEISEVIASEIADFFAGFGGPGESDIQSGEAQRLLTERLVSVLALRERAEPVEHEAHIRREVNAGGNTWIQCSKQAFEREKARGALCRVLYESPPAPVVPAETFDEWSRRCEIQLTLCRPEFREVAEITWNACRAAMLQPVSQPYKLSDGWIACSERIPDEGAEVYIFCDGEWVLEAQYREGDFYDVVRDGSEIFETVSRCVSHWQLRPQRPAAPCKEG